ncbi:unnamed protein product [Didymodactylos carnosus]|uniref:Flavin-containing monooxygenase n=1 Tax=Didymodactylos carnosus TaxID=1234261 RepID=A0A813WK65_9BILA|nr:unnamed protein product [Didymodactylos carnosus]CAF3644365.1 unnamed protein product [Didymodactylos carnosus]
MNVEENVKRVCIVGGGVSGLCCARVLLEYGGLEPVIFEQQAHTGGQWHYQNSLEPPITSAIYRDLISNLPCDVMQFSDFPFIGHKDSEFISAKDIEGYLLRYVEQHRLEKYLILNTKVDNVEKNSQQEGFTVTYSTRTHAPNSLLSALESNLESKIDSSTRIVCDVSERYVTYRDRFDAICICNGHFSEPHIPKICGYSTTTFPVYHSLIYRQPENYRNQTVVVVGAAHSGIDICGELAPLCKRVILSMKQDEDSENTFQRIIQLLKKAGKSTCVDYLNKTFSITSPIEKIDKDTIHFMDLSTVKPDSLIFATGYDYSYPFLSKNLSLQYDNRRFLYPIYHHIFDVNYPQGTLAYLTIPFNIVPMPLCEIQAHLIARVLKCRVTLPPTDEMLNKINQEVTSETNRNYHRVNMVKYIQKLFLLMNNESDEYAFKFNIDQDRRVRKLNKITNAIIIQQTIPHKQ